MRRNPTQSGTGPSAAARAIAVIRSIKAADAGLFLLVALSLAIDAIGAVLLFGGDL